MDLNAVVSADPSRGSTRRTFFACVGLCAISMLGLENSSAATYTLRADGSGDFATIQDAANAANPGDEIILEDGIYSGPGNRDVTFSGKDLIVRSLAGPANCVIDSEGTLPNPHRAFRLDDGETSAARIEGLTITGGFTTGAFPDVGGAGILITTNTSPTISQCIFDGNESGFQGFGAGLLAYNGCDVTIQDCIFKNGISGWYGGGFVLRLDCDGIVERCTVIDNYALHGGGGVSITNSDAQVRDCVIARNTCTEAGGGGALVKAGAIMSFDRCVFAENQAHSGAGIGMGNSPEVTARNCLFIDNMGTSYAGAVFSGDLSILHLENCTLANNTGPGAAVQAMSWPSGIITMRNCIVYGHCGPFTNMYANFNSTIDVDCSILEGGAASISGTGTILYGPGNLDVDPLFCDPAGCGDPGYSPNDWLINAASPAASGSNPCGLVGAYEIGCGATAIDEGLRTTTWGALKAKYLDPGTR